MEPSEGQTEASVTETEPIYENNDTSMELIEVIHMDYDTSVRLYEWIPIDYDKSELHSEASTDKPFVMQSYSDASDVM